MIHTVGPRYSTPRHAELLAACYRSCLSIARAHGLATVAFPAISTGVFGYPLRAATEIAVRTLRAELADHAVPDKVILCMFGSEATQVARDVLAGLAG